MNTPLQPFTSVAPIFAALPSETLQRLERGAEQRRYRKRQIVHFADQAADFVYLLCSGRVKISRTAVDGGREVTFYILGDKQVFGEQALDRENYPYDMIAETLNDSHIAVFRRRDILDAIQGNPEAMGQALRLALARKSEVESAVADLVFLDVPQRLAKKLLRLAGNGKMVPPFTHQQLAETIGSTRETTTFILNDFIRKGAIRNHGRRIVILDREILEDVLNHRVASSSAGNHRAKAA